MASAVAANQQKALPGNHAGSIFALAASCWRPGGRGIGVIVIAFWVPRIDGIGRILSSPDAVITAKSQWLVEERQVCPSTRLSELFGTRVEVSGERAEVGLR